jgi:hypothetical protein
MSKATATTETALAKREEHTAELQTTSAAALARYEIESAIIIALRNPRNELAGYSRLLAACERPSFADGVAYSFPRGGSTVTGPSVNLAREAARCFSNVRYGVDIVRDDDETRVLRGWSWDMETNVKIAQDDEFKKVVQRKRDGVTQWVVPDERDLRELTNRRGAILERNCILKLIPTDWIEDAMAKAAETRRKSTSADPEAARKKLVLAFGEIGVTVDDLEKKLGHTVAQCTPAEVDTLRTIYRSIRDGNSSWYEYVNGQSKREPERGALSVDDVKASTEENRGHGNEGLGLPKSLADEIRAGQAARKGRPDDSGSPFDEE